MTKTVGVVQVVKNNGKMWSLKVNDGWYGCGFKQPKVKEGDLIEFDVKQNGQYLNVASVEGIIVKEQEAPKPTTVKASGAGREDYWQNKAVEDAKNQFALRWQGARTNAIQVVDMLIRNDAVALGKAKEAKYDIVLNLIDLVTERFYNQASAMYDTDGDVAAAMSVGNEVNFANKASTQDEE